MATYGALVSVTNLIDQVQLYHSHKPTFTAKQLLQIQSLQENAYFLQDFLEKYNPHGVLSEDLERRIADVAYRTEDIIESHMVDAINARILKPTINNQLSDLGEVIESMDPIREEVANIKKKGEPLIDHERQDLVPVGPARSSTTEKDTEVLFEDELNEIMAKLIGQGSCLQIIPITGMGGIGKTTLARHAYDSAYAVEYFDIRGWITVSQTYDEREILSGLALGVGVHIDNNIEYHQLVETLYKHLSGRRYLIIIDDIWDIDAWDKMKASFPRNNNGSRIMVTSRLSNVANYFDSSDVYRMNLLDEDKSWRLLCRKVFVRECCPLELEEIGKKIAKSCKGLPLSIAVIGGLLAKSEMTHEYWDYVTNNINTTIYFEDEERCVKILSLSYSHLPIHLKPCFLYMGLFPEDHEIRVSKLIKLWVAEGFLKPNMEKSLEEVAEDYLKDLIGRNLIFVKLGSTGNLKICKIHDLLRDLCLKEAHRERLFCVSNSTVHNHDSECNKRRIAIHPSATYTKYSSEISYTYLPRTVLSFANDSMPSTNSKLLRICSGHSFSEGIISSKNSRYLNFHNLRIPDEICCFWNLQTLVIRGFKPGRVAPSEIWEMPQLRHLQIENISLPDPPSGGTNGHKDFVLRNLQTVSCIDNFMSTEEVLRRIPNIKKLKVYYLEHDKGFSHYCSKNLENLHKLQSLKCNLDGWATRSDLLQNLGFSTSLKKLTLLQCGLDWEDIATKIGPLPNLEKLRFSLCIRGEEWSPVEGQFLRLKFLKICSCGLVRWIADDTHFPCLERLVLEFLSELEEIPLGFANIVTLQSIIVTACGKSVVASAKEIKEEQQNLGMRIFVLLWWVKTAAVRIKKKKEDGSSKAMRRGRR